MNIHSFKPQNPVLKNYVEFYYFLKSENPEFNAKYFAFPNVTTPLSIHKNVRTEIKAYSTSVFAGQVSNYAALVQGMRKQPLSVNLKGKIDKVTIIFKPLGLNHFIEKSFAEITPRDSQLFEEWNNNIDYAEFLGNFYAADGRVERVGLLENFLLSVYKLRENQTVLEKAIEVLTDFNDEKTIDEISRQLNLNVRTFNRMFRNEVGISPAGFRKIARFRHSLESKIFNKQFQRLTDLAYQSNYYDQAYFIKIYRKMTGANPTNFFTSIEKLADDKIIFKFIR
jgi:AraC-like DNA-binding protein